MSTFQTSNCQFLFPESLVLGIINGYLFYLVGRKKKTPFIDERKFSLRTLRYVNYLNYCFIFPSFFFFRTNISLSKWYLVVFCVCRMAKFSVRDLSVGIGVIHRFGTLAKGKQQHSLVV